MKYSLLLMLLVYTGCNSTYDDIYTSIFNKCMKECSEEEALWTEKIVVKKLGIQCICRK